MNSVETERIMGKCKGEGEGKECVINGSRVVGKLRDVPFLLIVSTAVSPTVQMLLDIGQQMKM